MLHYCVVVDSLNDIVGHSLHGIFLLIGILIKWHLECLFMQLVLLREVFASKLELLIPSLTHQILDVVD